MNAGVGTDESKAGDWMKKVEVWNGIKSNSRMKTGDGSYIRY
jgi:hypothetical protein